MRTVPSTPRSVISFLSDFGLDGAAAICRGVMLSISPDLQIIDIAHSIRKFAVGDGAFILSTALPFMPTGVHLAVVDPGVGTQRRPVALRVARGDTLVGPDNGLLMLGAEALGGITDARELDNQALWLGATTSTTFHGRDILAPVAARLAAGLADFEEVGTSVEIDSLVILPPAVAEVGDGWIETEVIYVDSFGNLRLAGGAQDLVQALGDLTDDLAVRMEMSNPAGGSPHVESARFAKTFGAVPSGAALLYLDSSGHLALADNQGSTASRLGIATGARVRISVGD
jgi:S-adenosyl-L-methionine hydrolase (adenosine-forming)